MPNLTAVAQSDRSSSSLNSCDIARGMIPRFW